MPGYTSYDTVGAKEDVSAIITNLTPTKTPFQSMIGQEKIKARLHEWQEDTLAAVVDNAEIEGFTAANITLTATTMRSNGTQIFSKTIEVTGTADSVDNHGRDKEMAYQLRKKAQEAKRDFEHSLIGTAQVYAVGNNSTARKFAGVQAQIAASVTETAPDGDAGTGGLQVSALTEAMHLSANQKLYNAGSEAGTFMVKPNDSVRVANFATASGRTRDLGGEKKIVNAVDILVTPFGTQRVVMNRFIKSTDALLVDGDNWKKLVLRPWFRETLAKTGDSTRIMMVGEFSLKHTNREATGLLTNLAP